MNVQDPDDRSHDRVDAGVELAQESGDQPILADGVVIVGSPADMKAFFGGFVNAIAQHRNWGLQKKMVVPGSFALMADDLAGS